jgi:hypothetical protein
MDLTTRLQWIKTGAIAGVTGIVCYFAAAFIPLPDSLSYLAAFAFGPLLAIGLTGLYFFLSSTDKSPRVTIAWVSAIAAGVVLLIMLTVQQSIFSIIVNAKDSLNNTDADTVAFIKSGLNSIHFGMDIAWDVLISISTILFGFTMLRKRGVWKAAGAVGLVSGMLLISFNLYYFPTPPSSIGSIDFGPLVALWLAAIFILLLVKRRKICSVLTEENIRHSYYTEIGEVLEPLK